MKLTADLFSYLLSREFPVSLPENWQGEREIPRVQPWIPGGGPTDALLLVQGESDVDGDQLVLHIYPGSGEDMTETGRSRYCLYAGDMTYENVIYRVLDIYYEFIRLDAQITERTASAHDLLGAFELMGRYMKVNLGIVDKNFIVVEERVDEANAALANISRYSIGTGKRMEPGHIEQLYIENPRFDDTFSQRGLVEYRRYDYPEYQGRCLYYNFFLRGQYAGRLLFIIREDLYSDALLPFFSDYSEQIFECYRYRDEHSISRASTAVHRYLLDLVDGSGENLTPAVTAFGHIGWEAEDSYRAICMTGKGYAQSEMTMAYLSTLLEDAFPACVAVCRGQTIFCLHDRTREGRENFSGDLAVFLRENLLQAGLSCVYTGLENSAAHFREAEAALRIGEETDNSFWLHYFHDHTIAYALEAAGELIPSEDLYSPALKKLLEYDRTRPGLSLADTLMMFFACQFNATKAAEKLYIHRTTLVHRLQKIRDLTNIDFDDWDTVEELTLSFAVYRRLRGIK